MQELLTPRASGLTTFPDDEEYQPLAGHDAAAPRDMDDGLDAPLLIALRHLPDRQREVIALRVFLDLDIDTIAGHLGIAPGTIRVHLSRAVTALRHELSPSQAMEAD